MSINVKDEISKELTRLSNKFPDGVEKAAGRAALAMIQYSQQGYPRPPKKTGNLRRSWFAGSQGKIIEKGPDADVGPTYQFRAGTINAIAGYSADYAMKVHETFKPAGKIQARLPDSGGKFLETAVFERATDIMSAFVGGLRNWIKANTN